jgi:hypothetical protein
MDKGVDKLSELEEQLFDAAEKAVAELIKVAKATIIKPKGFDVNDEVAVDKMKNAAAAKKAAMFDAWDIIDKTRERKKLKEGDPEEEEKQEKKKPTNVSFAESRAK